MSPSEINVLRAYEDGQRDAFSFCIKHCTEAAVQLAETNDFSEAALLRDLADYFRTRKAKVGE